jgi:hypothetical protein
MDMWKPIEFWIAVAVAIIVKVRTSERLTFWQVSATIAVSVGAAYVAADWVSEALGTGEALAAALVALTAEGLMRWVIIAINDPQKAIALIKEWKR